MLTSFASLGLPTHYARGGYNAITDVPGVRVGHVTLSRDLAQSCVRTGVTVIEPREGWARLSPCFAGVHVLNGNGDASGLEWIREAGLLTSAIATTNTHSVGVVRDALIAFERAHLPSEGAVYWNMPVVLETFDGILNDINGQHIHAQHVFDALGLAQSGAVAQGSVGGGHGMICHEFKGGIGSASRVLPAHEGGWTVGALVQANHGNRQDLCIGGFRVGQYLPTSLVPSPFEMHTSITPGLGSIVVVIATNAPLLPHQCTRLAQRASIGIARLGGGTEDSSGDIFLAFSTGNVNLPVADYAHKSAMTSSVNMVNNDYLSALFAATADCVEESIINALLAAHEVQGQQGAKAHPLCMDTLRQAIRQCAQAALDQGE